MTEKMKELLELAKGHGWVCPQPQLWNRLWEMLPERKQVGAVWNPPPPLILAAWWDATDEQKRERFTAHLQWADKHDAANEIFAFLESLSPEDWFNGNN